MRTAGLGLLAVCCFLGGALSVASAQTPGTTPPQTTPQPPAAQPQPPPAQPAPAQPAPSQPAPAPAPPTATQPPPPSYPQTEPPPPPPPHYEPLGVPEPEIQPATENQWDPWEHVVTGDNYRHNGFFLRLTIGPSLAFVNGEDHVFRGVDEVSLTGFGFAASIAIGGALVDNLILNADLFQSTIFNPSVDVDGEDLGDAEDLEREIGIGEDAELVGIAIGLTYYIMPVNIYVSGAVGIGQVVFEDGNGDREGSDIGFAGNALVGKEWWVGDDWGLGLAAQVMFAVVDDDVLGDTVGTSINLLFSATYN